MHQDEDDEGRQDPPHDGTEGLEPTAGPATSGLATTAKFWAGLVSGFVLILPATLIAMALVPTLLGLTSATVVGSGSMSPALRVGDVVVLEAARHGGRGLEPPSVVLVDRPDGAPLLHRVTGLSPDGRGYTTRGDANAQDDSETAPFNRVRGVGRVALPVIGIPLVWLDDGDLGPLALLVAAVAALSVLARYGWSDHHDPWGQPDRAQTPVDHFEPVSRTAGGRRPGPRHATLRARRPRLPRAPRALHLPGTLVAVGLFAAAAGPASLPLAGAAFTATTDNPGNLLVADALAPPASVTATTTCTPGGGGGTAPAPVISTIGSGSGGNTTLTIPATVQAGDVMVAQFTTTGRGGGAPVAPPSWQVLNFADSGRQVNAQLSQRVATSADAGTRVTWSSSGTSSAVGLVVVRGGAPASSAAGLDDVNSISVAPGRSPTSAPSTLLTFHVAQVSQGFASGPPGMAERYASKGSFLSLGAYSQALPTTAATGTRTATLNGYGPTVAQSVVLAAGAPTPATTRVDLAWTATTSTYADGYEILRDGTLLATVIGPATTFTSTEPGTGTGPVTYSVRSTAGSWRSSATAAPPVAPACP